MPGVALIAHFEGDPDELGPSFRAAARRYATLADTPQPTTALLLRNKAGITVVMAWEHGASMQPFREFLRGALDEHGLPHPRVEHARAEAVRWEDITASG